MTEVIAPPVVAPPRPALVWLIFVFYVVTAGWGLVLQCLMFLGLYTLTSEQQALVGNMSEAARLLGVSLGVLNIAAAVSLWLLRRAAFPLFSAALALGLVTTVTHMLPGGPYSRMFAQGLLMQVITTFSIGVGLLITVAIWFYVLRLWRQGVLR